MDVDGGRPTIAAFGANSVLGSKDLDCSIGLWHLDLVSAQWVFFEAYLEAMMCPSQQLLSLGLGHRCS